MLMKVRFTKRARHEFFHLVDVFTEFAGQKAANNFIERFNAIGEQLCRHPYTGYPEPLLMGRKKLYRTKTINKNYRIIYYVARINVWIVDIWDRRRNPSALKKRLK